MMFLRRMAPTLGAVLVLILAIVVLTPVPHAAALTGAAAATPTKTKTKTTTKTATKSTTPTQTRSSTPTDTLTLTNSHTPTQTRSSTPSNTFTPTQTRSSTPTYTLTATPINVAGVSISAGDRNTCVVDRLGRARCVGNNEYGQLGQGDTVQRGDVSGTALVDVPYISLGTGAVVKSIKTRYGRTCALLTTGVVKCWGSGDFGALGYGSSDNVGDAAGEMGDALPAVSLPTGRYAIAIQLTYANTCAILDNGSLVCWGDSIGIHERNTRHGETPGTMGDNLTPIDLGTGRTVTAVDGGDRFLCALLDNGQLKCFGVNSYGILGVPTSTTSIGSEQSTDDMGDNLAPVNLGTGLTVTAFGANNVTACALLSNATVKCWGGNERGQLGNGTMTNMTGAVSEMGDNLAPINLGTGRTAVAIAVGPYQHCATLDTGAVKCWGMDTVGSLGVGSSETIVGDALNEMGDNLQAIDFGTTAAVEQMEVGFLHACFLLSTKTISCYGYAGYGALGYGDTVNRGRDADTIGANTVLYAADASTGAITMTPTKTHTPTITLTPTRTPTATPPIVLGVSISAGDRNTCVVDRLGRARCVGNNEYGQLGQGDTVQRGDVSGKALVDLPYISLGTGAVVKSIKTRYGRTCALLTTGAVKCWGSGDFGALGYGNSDNVGDAAGEMGDALPAVSLPTGRYAIAIQLTYANTCAILDNGSLVCWGESIGIHEDSRHGETPGTMGDNLTPIDLGTGRTVQAVDGGDRFLCALLDNGQLKCFGYNSYGVLGVPTSTTSIGGAQTSNDMGDNLAPVNLGTGLTVTAFGANNVTACALLSNATVKCWGGNERGQLGNGSMTNMTGAVSEMGDNLAPINLGTGRTAVAIAVGPYQHCATLDTGAVKCWGMDTLGSLGVGSSETIVGDALNEMGDNLQAIDFGTTAAVEQMEVGFIHSCFLLSTKTISCYGYAGYGALGYGDTVHRGRDASTIGANTVVYAADASTGAITMTPTKTHTPTITPSPTLTLTPSSTLTLTLTTSRTATATRTATKTPTRSKTPTKSRTPTKKP